MTSARRTAKPRVLMFDLWATVPYYTAYLSRALLQAGVAVQIASITYYLDRKCFSGRNLRLQPGCCDVVGKLNLPRAARRAAKLLEGALNLAALTLRCAFRPPGVVHVQFLTLLRSRLPMDLWFVRFCRRRGSRLVLTVHDLLPHDTGETHRAVYQRLYAEMDALICHSAHIQRRLVEEFGVPPQKITVIPHGPFFYDLDKTAPENAGLPQSPRPGSKTVLWQGILFPYKGVDLLLEAWKEVEARTQELHLQVLGTGDPALLAALQEQAAQLALQHVRFDFRFCSAEELVAAYRSAAVVVYPYRAITTSGALATGLSLGKAIVASDLPVFREVLVDGKNALLVDPHRPEQLAEALLRAGLDDQVRAELSRNVTAMQFGDQSWAEIAEATEGVYRSVLAAPATASR